MRSPTVAMLWEIWRVSRTEVGWRLAIGIGGALAVLIVSAAFAPTDDPKRYERYTDFGAVIALSFIVMPHFMGWVTLARLNAGRPGFQLPLLYTRPIGTELMVGLPMVYLTAMPAASYLLSASLLKAIFGFPFPLLPVAAWIAALNVAYLAINWSTHSRGAMILGQATVSGAWMTFASHRLNDFPNDYDWHDSTKLWPRIFDFPLTDYVLIALAALACFAVAVVSVARQRHGVERIAGPSKAAWARASQWLVTLGGYPCPTSSAARAQIWFELRSSGLGVLVIGLATAILTPLMFAISVPLDWFFSFAISWVGLSMLGLLFVGTNSSFGLRAKNARLTRSDFDATLAVGSARLVGLKVIVRSVCALIPLIVLCVIAWECLSFVAVVNDYRRLRNWQLALEGDVGAFTGDQQLALVVVALIGFVALGGLHAALWVIWNRYSRRVNIAALVLLLLGLALSLLVLAESTGTASEFLVDALFAITRWIAATALVLATAYLFWNALTERVLTVRYACGALAVSAAFAAAWLAVLQGGGVQLGGMSATSAISMLWPLLLPLLASVVAPWSFSRIRHT